MKTILDYTREKRLTAEKMAADIVSRIDPDRILLFGSVGRGEARETSDIDLMVVLDSGLSFKQRMNFLYTEIERHDEVDMLWYTPDELAKMRGRSSFVRQALKEAVTLYERE
jgi:predicted nucleotidyltransferase